MPSGEHEAPIALAKLNPDVLAWLLAHIFHIKLPDYHHSRTHPTDVQVLVPRTYHADGMVLFCDAADRPVLGVVLEVQRGPDSSKRRTWKLYVAQLEAELDITVALVVYCPDPMVAGGFEYMFETDGLSLLLRPLIFTPEDVPLVRDAGLARNDPALSVLSAICHGDQAELDTMFPALAEALSSLGPKQAILYHDVVLAALPAPARVRWEEFMSITAEQYHSELFREIAAQHEELGEIRGEARGVARGEARGEARGKAQAVLAVLEARGVKVPVGVREQILSCGDLAELDVWLRRAVAATTADEVTLGSVDMR